MKYLMCALIRFYRKFISPIKPTCCRFTPSCSAYAFYAFRYRGFFMGCFLSVSRILRCNPFGKGGYDPVARPIAWKKIDILRKKMEKSPQKNETGVPSAVVTVEKKKKRKVSSLLPYERC